MEKTLMLRKIEGKSRGGRQKMSWLDGIINLMSLSLSKLWEILKDREAGCTAVLRVGKSRYDLSTEQNNNFKRMFSTLILYLPIECQLHGCNNFF